MHDFMSDDLRQDSLMKEESSMATTYVRLKAALQQTRKKDTWPNVHDLASEIRRRRLAPYRMRGDGSSQDHFMHDDAIESLLDLARNLQLIDERPDGTVAITSRATSALTSEDAFARQIRSSVKSYLNQCALPLEQLLDLIANIRLPDVPDAATIFERSQELTPKPNLDVGTLRMLLFLFALAGGMKRLLRVHYTSS